jgi:hypothetical protein
VGHHRNRKAGGGQLLATEHWSLLATRSMTQSEILNRITTVLLLVSASTVSLALIEQLTRFDRRLSARHRRGSGPAISGAEARELGSSVLIRCSFY